jgi:hypothetical protein
MTSDNGEEKIAEEGTMTIDERKTKMEQLRAKMVRGPLCIILLIPYPLFYSVQRRKRIVPPSLKSLPKPR